jgi:DNA-binding PadR family transcriptional regulator
LGLLSQGPLHGYELRKRVTITIGPLRAISFGSLYPELKRLSTLNLIEEKESNTERGLTKRARISYQITPQGTERLNTLLKSSGPETWEDETFTTYLSFFAKTASAVRLQILQGRKVRLQEKINLLQDQLNKTDQELDNYNLQISNYNLDSVKREMKWIDELISNERKES